MKIMKKSFLVMSLLVLSGMFYAGIWQAWAATLKQTVPPKNYVTFNWVDQPNKRFWVNNSYVRLFMDGTQGIGLIDLRHKSNLAQDLLDDIKTVVIGPQVGWEASRWPGEVPLGNINVSYTQVSPSFATLNVTGIHAGNNLKYTFLFDIADSEAIKITHKVTFLTDINVTQMGHEFVPAYVASVGSEVAYVNSTGYINFWNLTADWQPAIIANTTAGTFPLAENWIAIWNTTRNIATGLIFLNQSKLLNPLGKTMIAFWDGSGSECAALIGRWYEGPATLVPAGSVFEDEVLLLLGTGDYTDVRNLAGMVDEIVDPAFVGAIPQPTVTFNWVDQPNKRFWVNNSYVRLFMDGTQGIGLIDLRHKSNLAQDLLDDIKTVVIGPQVGWEASRWPGEVPLGNINVSYTQVSPSFATLNVTGIHAGNNLKYTFLFDIADSEAIKITHKVTFLTDINVTQMGHEFVPLPPLGDNCSEFACMNNTGYVNIWNLTGDWGNTYLANYTAGTFPLAENWIAIWNTTAPLAGGVILLNQSKLLGPLGRQSRALIGIWDGAAIPLASLYFRWYDGPATLISAGTVFEDTVILWIGTSDYTDVRNKAGTVLELTGYVQPPPPYKPPYVPPPGVGGEISLLDKLALMAPWIAIAAIVIVATVSVVTYRKRITKTL